MRRSPNEQALREWRRGAKEEPRLANKPVGTVLEKLLPKLGLEQQVRHGQLVTDWPRIVGHANARHSKPVAFRDGILIVSVDNSVWRMEFEYQKQLWLRKVAAHLKPTKLRDIEFRVEG